MIIDCQPVDATRSLITEPANVYRTFFLLLLATTKLRIIGRWMVVGINSAGILYHSSIKNIKLAPKRNRTEISHKQSGQSYEKLPGHTSLLLTVGYHLAFQKVYKCSQHRFLLVSQTLKPFANN